jgi:catechol 2,3-dioxygenase-like lactoylglutathione lyase family enzyme
MLSEYPVHATLPATDLARAKAFYADKLGLRPADENHPGGLFYEAAGGTRFLVYPTGGVASGAHTQLGWRVADLEAEVRALKARGVVFEEYDFPTLKTAGGIATTPGGKAAWFKDSEGNLLGIVQLG